jgi:hypothetical protein
MFSRVYIRIQVLHCFFREQIFSYRSIETFIWIGGTYFQMSFGVDVLGTLSEKLKHMFDETQGKYTIFANEQNLYSEQRIDEKEFILKIIEYLVNLSALNFLSIRVVLELKSAMDKGTSIKDATGGLGSSASQQPSFGIGGFIGAGGTAGIDHKSSDEQLVLPTFKPVDIEIERHEPPIEENILFHNNARTCHVCKVTISSKAKFCTKCGALQ